MRQGLKLLQDMRSKSNDADKNDMRQLEIIKIQQFNHCQKNPEMYEKTSYKHMMMTRVETKVSSCPKASNKL